jgi:lipopolysaccharide transport system ATP-binding protein
MGDIVVRLERIGKQYHIGRKLHGRKSVQDVVTDALISPFRWAGGLLRQVTGATDVDQMIWALRDVSFEIKRGEIVGIVGRNAAGKSTLLKILSRITEPTEGHGEIHGRVGSLLEVGTGFHPELTGRENLFLNGAILGMRKTEIERKFDEIVAFAEIDKFIDTPVKHYSSGMYVRLAFAVAAHLEPEILIVDEVLAVGDVAFQKKCLGKMSEVSRGGRTVLFVSHNMAAVENLCSRGILLDEGRVLFSGDMKQTVDHYLHSISGRGSGSHIVDLSQAAGRPRKCRPLLKRLELYTDQGKPLSIGLQMGGTLKAYIYFQLEEPTANFSACLAFDTLLGQRVFTAHSLFEPHNSWGQRVGEQVFICEIPSLTLVPGEYKLKVALDVHNPDEDCVEDAARLTILASDYYGTGKTPWNGAFVLKHRWHLHDAQRQEGSSYAQGGVQIEASKHRPGRS